MSHRLVALALLAPLALAGCGDATETIETVAPTTWETEELDGDLGVDLAPVMATSGGDVVVLAVSDEGVLRSHLSSDDALFRAGPPLATDLDHLLLGGVVALSDGGWFAAASGDSVEGEHGTELAHRAVGFRSDDGLTWEQVELSGFTGPVDVDAVEVVNDTVVVAGAYRTAKDPSSGGFEARVWTSDDAASFTEVSLPGVPPSTNYRNESYAGSVTVVGDRLLAAGRVGRSAALWSSDDAGASWQQVEDPTLGSAYAVGSLSVLGEVVVASVAGDDAGLLRSTDGGMTWTGVQGLPEGGEDEIASPVWSSGTRVWTLTRIDDYSWEQPEVCYADLAQCGKNPPPLMMTSTDGVTWTAVVSPGGYDGITGTTSGRVIALEGNTPDLRVHTLTPGAEPPAAPTAAEPATVRLDTVPDKGSPTVGVRYHAPMYLHCGMDSFHLGSTVWQRTDAGPDVETGPGDRPAEGWPIVGQVLYGYATLTAEDVLEYSIDGGEVIATYEPAKRASLCD